MSEREYVGEWKTVALPIPEPTTAIKGVKLPNGKCLLDDEPIIVKRKILPVDGSVQEHVTGKLKGGTIAVPNFTGDCPECFAHVPLSDKGFVTAHVVKGGTATPSSMLTEPQVDPTDTGYRIGDPRSAMQRRTVELDGAYEHGTVLIPVPGKNGRIKLQEAPATEENVRASLVYWLARKPRSESGRTDQNEHVSSLNRRLEAMGTLKVAAYDKNNGKRHIAPKAQGVAALKASESPEGLASPNAPLSSPISARFKAVGMSPGPALVKGRSEPTLAGAVTVRQQDEPYVQPETPEDKRPMGAPDTTVVTTAADPCVSDSGAKQSLETKGVPDTNVGPTGRNRLDKESSTVESVGGPYGYLTQAQFDALGCDHLPLPFGEECVSPDCARSFRTRSRKYFLRIRKQEAYAKAHQSTQTRVLVKLGTAGTAGSSFAEGDSRETERVMRQAPRA